MPCPHSVSLKITAALVSSIDVIQLSRESIQKNPTFFYLTISRRFSMVYSTSVTGKAGMTDWHVGKPTVQIWSCLFCCAGCQGEVNCYAAAKGFEQ